MQHNVTNSTHIVYIGIGHASISVLENFPITEIISH